MGSRPAARRGYSRLVAATGSPQSRVPVSMRESVTRVLVGLLSRPATRVQHARCGQRGQHPQVVKGRGAGSIANARIADNKGTQGPQGRAHEEASPKASPKACRKPRTSRGCRRTRLVNERQLLCLVLVGGRR